MPHTTRTIFTAGVGLGLAGMAGAQCVPAPVALQQATGTWTQPCAGAYRPANTIDGDTRTSWALGRCDGAPDQTLTESLVFETTTDIVGLGASLELALFSGRFDPCCGGGMMTLGRFRVCVTGMSRQEFADGRSIGGQIGEGWTVLAPDSVVTEATDAFGVPLASSQNTPGVSVLGGGVIEIGGANPEYARYVVKGRSPIERVTGVRIEMINDAAPVTGGFRGPGRHANGNCEIREVSLASASGPRIDTHPEDQFVCPGGSASFFVGVSGPGPIRYQWRRNGRDLRGATGNVYVVPASTTATAGTYDCIVTGPCGSTMANPARLVLCPADYNCDQFLDFFDYDAFVMCFDEGICEGGTNADFNGDGFVDFFDYDAFVAAFEAGC
jgi:hypothetical protein